MNRRYFLPLLVVFVLNVVGLHSMISGQQSNQQRQHQTEFEKLALSKNKKGLEEFKAFLSNSDKVKTVKGREIKRVLDEYERRFQDQSMHQKDQRKSNLAAWAFYSFSLMLNLKSLKPFVLKFVFQDAQEKLKGKVVVFLHKTMSFHKQINQFSQQFFDLCRNRKNDVVSALLVQHCATIDPIFVDCVFVLSVINNCFPVVQTIYNNKTLREKLGSNDVLKDFLFAALNHLHRLDNQTLFTFLHCPALKDKLSSAMKNELFYYSCCFDLHIKELEYKRTSIQKVLADQNFRELLIADIGTLKRILHIFNKYFACDLTTVKNKRAYQIVQDFMRNILRDMCCYDSLWSQIVLQAEKKLYTVVLREMHKVQIPKEFVDAIKNLDVKTVEDIFIPENYKKFLGLDQSGFITIIESLSHVVKDDESNQGDESLRAKKIIIKLNECPEFMEHVITIALEKKRYCLAGALLQKHDKAYLESTKLDNLLSKDDIDGFRQLLSEIQEFDENINATVDKAINFLRKRDRQNNRPEFLSALLSNKKLGVYIKGKVLDKALCFAVCGDYETIVYQILNENEYQKKLCVDSHSKEFSRKTLLEVFKKNKVKLLKAIISYIITQKREIDTFVKGADGKKVYKTNVIGYILQKIIDLPEFELKPEHHAIMGQAFNNFRLRKKMFIHAEMKKKFEFSFQIFQQSSDQERKKLLAFSFALPQVTFDFVSSMLERYHAYLKHAAYQAILLTGLKRLEIILVQAGHETRQAFKEFVASMNENHFDFLKVCGTFAIAKGYSIIAKEMSDYLRPLENNTEELFKAIRAGEYQQVQELLNDEAIHFDEKVLYQIFNFVLNNKKTDMITALLRCARVKRYLSEDFLLKAFDMAMEKEYISIINGMLLDQDIKNKIFIDQAMRPYLQQSLWKVVTIKDYDFLDCILDSDVIRQAISAETRNNFFNKLCKRFTTKDRALLKKCLQDDSFGKDLTDDSLKAIVDRDEVQQKDEHRLNLILAFLNTDKNLKARLAKLSKSKKKKKKPVKADARIRGSFMRSVFEDEFMPTSYQDDKPFQLDKDLVTQEPSQTEPMSPDFSNLAPLSPGSPSEDQDQQKTFKKTIPVVSFKDMSKKMENKEKDFDRKKAGFDDLGDL